MTQIPINQDVRTLARRASAAITWRRFLRSLPAALLWVLGAALLVTVALRLWGSLAWSWAWWAPGVIGVIGAVLVCAIRSLGSRVSDEYGAGLLDARLGLESQLRSALELEHESAASGFSELAQRRASALAAGISIEPALEPVEARVWWGPGVLAVLIVATGLWLPPVNPGRARAPKVVPQGAIASIDETIASQGEDEAGADGEPEPVAEALRELEELKQELAQGVERQDEADAQTSAKLQKLADALQEDAEQTQRQNQELAEEIRALQNLQRQQQREMDPRVDEFARALQERRFDEAAERLDQIQRQSGQMSPEERDAMAQQLEELANAIEPDPVEEPEDQDRPTPPDAREETEASEPESQRRDQQDGARDERDGLSESLREEAKRLREQAPELRQQDRPEQDKQEQGEQEQGRSQQEQSGGERGPEQPQEDRAPEQGGDDQDQQGQEQQRQGAQEPRRDGQGERRPSEDGGAQDQAQRQEEAKDQGQERGEPGQRQAEGGQEGGQEEGQPESPRPGAEPDGSAGDQREDRRQGQGDEGGDPGDLRERLREMEQRRRQAQRNSERAQEIRERARELIEPGASGRDPRQDQNQEQDQPGASREQTQRPPSNEGGGGDGPRTQSPAPATDPDAAREYLPVDAAGDEQGESGDPVGKWYAPEGEAPEQGDAKQAAQRLRQAAQRAQRAVDQQQVPRKYRHLVREVFRRVEDRANELGGTGKIAPQGQDAKPTANPKSGDAGSGDQE